MSKQFRKLPKSDNVSGIDSAKAQKFIDGATGDYDSMESSSQTKVKHIGRPKVSSEEKIKLSLYVSKSQNDFISSTASNLGMSKNNYILYMLFKKESIFSNADMEKLLVCARESGVGLNEYIRAALKLDT